MERFLDLEIRERLARYVTGRSSRWEFEGWFVPVAMEVEHSGNPAAISLAYLVELRLAEHTSGHLTEDELKRVLKPPALVDEVRTRQATERDVESPAIPRIALG